MAITTTSRLSRLREKWRARGHPFQRRKADDDDDDDDDARSIEDCDCEPDSSLLEELHEPPDLASAWFNVPWAAKGKNGVRSITALVDSGSGHSMIRCHAVKILGLPVRPLLEPKPLGGFGGGSACAREFVFVELECPLIGQERVRVPIYVVHAREIRGLLIGTKFITKYHIFKKIEEVKERHGLLPPGVTIQPVTTQVSIVAPIFDHRPKGIISTHTFLWEIFSLPWTLLIMLI